MLYIGSYHERSGLPRFYPAVDVIEETACLAFNFHIVTEILPVKDRSPPLNCFWFSRRLSLDLRHRKGFRIGRLFIACALA